MSRRGENIRKRKDGRWEGRYIKGYDSKKQKARYASVYGKTYAETKQKLDEAKYKPDFGFLGGKKKTFDIIRRRGHKVNMQEKPGMVSESYPSLYEARKSEKTADKK